MADMRWIGVALALVGLSASADDATARAYLDAWALLDYDKAASYLTERSRFEDPTSVAFGEPWRHEGAEAIVAFFRDSNERYGTLSIVNHYETLATSGPWVVLRYAAEVTSCAVLAGQPTKAMTGTIHVVTALRIEDGKVLEHVDYADYDRVARELPAIREALTRTPDDPRCRE